MLRSFLNRLLGPVFDFAGDCWADARDSETTTAVQLGGCSLAEYFRCHATGARPTDCEIPIHNGEF